MIIHFLNVRVSISADTPKEAYRKLAAAVGSIPAVEWESDTFCTDQDPDETSTEALIPSGYGK